MKSAEALWRASRPVEATDATQESFFRELAIGGSRVSLGQIGRLESSPHAIAWDLLNTLPGEVDWQSLTFTGVMDDGAHFSFHTASSVGFFDMPLGYDARRLRKVLPGGSFEQAHREREGFASYVEGADFGAMPTRCRMPTS